MKRNNDMTAGERAEDWRSRGRSVEVDGLRLFVVESGDPEAVPVLFLHGYPSCSYDFHKVFRRKGEDYCFIAHDHIGFGWSEKPVAYSYSLMDQARTALQLWEKAGVKKAHLVAHDYGTSVATELLAMREQEGIPIEFLSLTLTNGSVHIELARLRLIQYLLRNRLTGPAVAALSNRWVFRRQMRSLWFDRSACDQTELDVLWHMMASENGHRVLPAITQYLHERYRYWDRWIGALTRLNIPAHVVWAQNDPVSVKAIGERLAAEIPGAQMTRLDRLGHYPMLEDPDRWTSSVMDFIHKNTPL